jgi:hypothetical protein
MYVPAELPLRVGMTDIHRPPAAVLAPVQHQTTQSPCYQTRMLSGDPTVTYAERPLDHRCYPSHLELPPSAEGVCILADEADFIVQLEGTTTPGTMA